MFKTKEELMAMGLTAEQADAVIKAHNDTIKDQFVPKHRFDEVYQENTANKQTITSLNQQITQLGSFQGTAEELQQQVNTLTTQNTELQTQHQRELDQLRLDNAIKFGIASYERKPHDVDLVLGKLDKSKLSLKEDGTVEGLNDQLAGIVKSSEFLFAPISNPNPKPAWMPKGDDPTPGKDPATTLSVSEQFGAALAKGRSSIDAGTQSGLDYFFGPKK